MASISTAQKTGLRTLQFANENGERKTIRLGKMNLKGCAIIKSHVEAIVMARLGKYEIRAETAAWLGSLDDKMRAKLAKAGLLESRATVALGDFLKAYVNSRCDVKPTTKLVYGHTRRNLIEHFGEGKRLRDITPGDAELWRLGLIRQDLSDNTVRRRTGIARQYFNAAIRRGLIDKNPFDGLPAVVRPNRQRMHFIPPEDAAKILEACPDNEWRLVFALSRFGGLRTPSETLRLRWQDVDWANGRITVHSPKTEHHVGGECRQIPLFPELVPYLREQFERADEGAVYVMTRYRDTTMNLRTGLQKIIARAGLTVWPKLYHNLRATRQTELEQDHPTHVVCAWLGNSRPVAIGHYLMVTDEHFEAASAPDSALQKPTQHTAARACTELQPESDDIHNFGNCSHLRSNAAACESAGNPPLGVTGLEPVTP